MEAELLLSEDAGPLGVAPTFVRYPAPDAGANTQRWAGAVYTPQGEVACMPFNARHVLFIATDGGTRLGPLISGSVAYNGGVLGAGDIIYAAPSSSMGAQLLRIDSSTGATVTRALNTGSASGGPRFCGAIADTVNRMWLIPSGSLTVARYDTLADQVAEFTAIDGGSTQNKWCGGALLPDGRIFGMPQNRQELLVIDPSDGGVRRVPISIGGARQYSAVLARNGNLYGVPQGFINVVEFQPDAGARNTNAASDHYNGGALAPDGRIVFIPESNAPVLVFDPRNDGAQPLATSEPMSAIPRWHGAATGKDGRIYACPYNSPDVLVIDVGSRRPLADRALLSPWLNKL